MRWWSDFANEIEHDAPLGRMTWFRLGGPARFLFRPRSVSRLARLAVRAKGEGVPLRVLGAGANVLISDDGYDGVVVRLDQPAFRSVQRRGSTVVAGGGVDLMPLVKECSTSGLSGLEYLAGVPASVGGAVKMNAGGRGGELGDAVRTVDVLRGDGETESWSRERVGFGYRRTHLENAIVLSATLELKEDDPERVKRTYDENFESKQKCQPLKNNSAGCIFKNPPGRSAGAMIDKAGLKGRACGSARVSERHANFIVAEDGATTSDVLRLIDLIRDRVRRAFDIDLDVEVDIW